jgi:hypothetical protein
MSYERLSPREMRRWDALVAKLQAAQGSPSASPQAIADLLSSADEMRRIFNSVSPVRAYRVQFQTPVIVANTGITPTALTPFNFPKPGRVIGLKGMVREGLNLVTHVCIGAQDAEGYQFFQNGTAGDFMSIAAMSGNPYDQAGWFPFFFRSVRQNEQWSFVATSLDALPGAGSTTYTPELWILMELDDLVNNPNNASQNTGS